MNKTQSSITLLIIWIFTWFLGQNSVLMGVHGFYVYLTLVIVVAVLLIIFRKKLYKNFSLLGVLGLGIVVVLNILSSPHRFERVKAWIDAVL